MFILLPIVYPIEKLRSIFPSVHNEAVTRDELSHLADIAEESQVIERDEEKVIQNFTRIKRKNCCVNNDAEGSNGNCIK